VSESSQEAFERGHRAGGVEAQLAEHQKHLQTINGSIDRGVDGLASVNLTVQHMYDELTAKLDTVIATAKAAADTVVATAEALRQQGEAQRTADQDATTKSDRSWTPFTRFFAVLAATATGVVIWATLFRHH
jgi:hypothetical protein